jgi:hypothetical protein
MVKLPEPKEIRDLLEDLLARKVEVSVTDPPPAADLERGIMSVYRFEGNGLAAAFGMDLPLSAYIGAAIGLLPPGGAQDCVDEGVLPPTHADNVREVCNVMASLLNHPGRPHVKLERTVTQDAPPDDVRTILIQRANRLDLAVDVAGYGRGRLAVTVTE